MAREFGDLQTPPALVAGVLECLGPIGTRWARVLEPTCGRGNFIAGLLQLDPPPREIRGIELQESHFEAARELAGRSNGLVEIVRANLFALNLRRDITWRESGPLLVVGNPPWVTNSELGALDSGNVPQKRNLKALSGLEAMTGAANFDIAEYILVKIIRELAQEEPTIALLCKTSVARNLIEFADRCQWPIASASIRRIDAKRWFGASVDACLFTVQVGNGHSYEAGVYPNLESTDPEATIGVINGRLVADVQAYRRCAAIDGLSPMTWRQGVKHDAASVLELDADSTGVLRNRLGEEVIVEHDHIYPLAKGSDLPRAAKCVPSRYVVIPQRRLGEDTRLLQSESPRLWCYLGDHAEFFDRRKSSIYRDQPPFSIFGIGPYSFAPYKVGISGLHKRPRFRAIGPVAGRPVMFDDTCYFVACQGAQQAALLAALLNSPTCLALVHSLMFWDAKRPITKRLLQRIDLKALLDHIDEGSLLDWADRELKGLGSPADSLPTSWPRPLDVLLSDQTSEAAELAQMAFEWAS